MEPDISKRQTSALTQAHLSAARQELRSIVRATEAAVTRIMQCAEAVLDADRARPQPHFGLVQKEMLAIFEACSFQDLTGQRIAKVAAQLQEIEAQLAGGPARRSIKRANAGGSRTAGPVLHGPQSDGQGNSQADIDALFNPASKIAAY
jgi:chemotaxis protein CheZ